MAVEEGRTPDDGRVVAEEPVPVELGDLFEDERKQVERAGAERPRGCGESRRAVSASA